MDSVKIHTCALNRNTRQTLAGELSGKHRHDLDISREGDAADLGHLGRVNTPTTRPQTDSSPCNPAGSGAACVGRLHSSSPVEDEGVSARDHSRGRPGKRRNEDAMDHSGLGNRPSAKRVQMMQQCNGALLCLTPRPLTNQMTAEQVGKELARCLHEPKHNLLKDTVEVLGVERTVEFFTKTAEIQEQGGTLTAEGDKKRAPGGVFFSLVKSGVSEEEKKSIFAKDKRLMAKRAKQLKEAKKRKKWKEDENKRKRETEEGARKQLETFKRELENPEDRAPIVLEKVPERERLLLGIGGHPPDKNMEKRGRGSRGRGREREPDYCDLDDPNSREDGEIVEGWRNGGCDDDGDDFESHIDDYENLRRKISQKYGEQEEGEIEEEMETGNWRTEGKRERKNEERRRRSEGGVVDGAGGRGSAREEVSTEERSAVERFEKTDECDFGINLSDDF